MMKLILDHFYAAASHLTLFGASIWRVRIFSRVKRGLKISRNSDDAPVGRNWSRSRAHDQNPIQKFSVTRLNMLRPPSHGPQRANPKPKRNCLKISLGILGEWRKRKLRDCSRLLLSTFPVHRKHANNGKHTTEWQKRFEKRAGTRNEPSGRSGIVRDRSQMSHLRLGVSPSLLLISSRDRIRETRRSERIR